MTDWEPRPQGGAVGSRLESTNENLRGLGHVCVLVLVPGALAWLFGRPLIFPSLGPSALALALDSDGSRGRQVIGGHWIGVVRGLIAYHALARGLSLAALAAAPSLGGLRIVASGVLSVGLTTWLMLATRTTHHPPAQPRSSFHLVLPGLGMAP